MDGKAAGTLEQGEMKTEEAAKPLKDAHSPQNIPESSPKNPSNDTGARFEALAQERTALKDHVAELRRTLEEIQRKHEEDMGAVRHQLVERTGEKEQAETQYRNLLGKVNTIRSQLGERLKADAVGRVARDRQKKELTLERKTWLKPKVGSRSSKSSAIDFVLKTKPVPQSCPAWWQKGSSARKSYRVCGTGPRYLSRIGRKKGKI